MESDTIKGIDYTMIEGIQRKRILKFVNHFIVQVTNFLSNFSQTCDEKMLMIGNRLNSLETSLTLLEHKLDSLPIPKQDQNADILTKEKEKAVVNDEPKIQVESSIAELELDPNLIKFKKMIDVGVPRQAVEQKMYTEGFNEEEISLLFTSLKVQ